MLWMSSNPGGDTLLQKNHSHFINYKLFQYGLLAFTKLFKPWYFFFCFSLLLSSNSLATEVAKDYCHFSLVRKITSRLFPKSPRPRHFSSQYGQYFSAQQEFINPETNQTHSVPVTWSVDLVTFEGPNRTAILQIGMHYFPSQVFSILPLEMQELVVNTSDILQFIPRNQYSELISNIFDAFQEINFVITEKDLNNLLSFENYWATGNYPKPFHENTHLIKYESINLEETIAPDGTVPPDTSGNSTAYNTMTESNQYKSNLAIWGQGVKKTGPDWQFHESALKKQLKPAAAVAQLTFPANRASQKQLRDLQLEVINRFNEMFPQEPQ